MAAQNFTALKDVPYDLLREINPLIQDAPSETLARLEDVLAFLTANTGNHQTLMYMSADGGLSSIIEVCLHTLQYTRMAMEAEEAPTLTGVQPILTTTQL